MIERGNSLRFSGMGEVTLQGHGGNGDWWVILGLGRFIEGVCERG